METPETLIGESNHFMNKVQQFLDKIKDITVEKDVIILSFDVTAHFTWIGLRLATKILGLLQKHFDTTLSRRLGRIYIQSRQGLHYWSSEHKTFKIGSGDLELAYKFHQQA